jgi:hypothetical protein
MKIFESRLLLSALLSVCLIASSSSVSKAQSFVNNKLFVDISVAGSGDGSSWSQALKHLSDALELAKTNPAIDSILVAQGTYSPVILYPNPTTDIVFLENATPGDLYSINDLTGRMVQKGVISNMAHQINVQLIKK